jgi:transposase InsO family protein
MRDWPYHKSGKGELSSGTPFTFISLDYVGPRTWFGQDYYFLVIIDHYSRFVVADTTRDGKDIMDTIRNKWVPYFGNPDFILTDQGIFRSEGFRDFVSYEIKARVIQSSAYYPQGNGMNESCHRLIEHAVRTNTKCGMNIPLNEIVQEAVLVHNSSPNSTTGETPAYLVFGTDLVVSGWQEFTEKVPEEVRLLRIKDRRVLKHSSIKDIRNVD